MLLGIVCACWDGELELGMRRVGSVDWLTVEPPQTVSGKVLQVIHECCLEWVVECEYLLSAGRCIINAVVESGRCRRRCHRAQISVIKSELECKLLAA